MAKCGCAGQGGSVVFEDTPGVDITGAGTVTNPYRINVRQLYMTVADTPSLNLTLTGTGSETNPYLISGVATPATAEMTPAESQTWGGIVNLTSLTAPRMIRAQLNANVTAVNLPTWSSAVSGSIMLFLSQDATGGRTWVMPGTGNNGADIVLSTAPNARDFIRAYWTGLQWILTAEAMNVS